MARYGWARWGDVNAFFGLMLDNVAALLLLVALVASDASSSANRADRFTAWFVIEWIIPGSGLRQQYQIADALLESEVARTHRWRDMSLSPRRILPPQSLVVALTSRDVPS